MADIKGIDVSYHNGTIDWRKVKQSVDFAIIRAGYGRSKADKRFIYNITEARKAGLETGVYWFIYAKDAGQAVENAKKCEECIRDYRDKITMRVWADWEYASDERNPQTKKSRTEIVRAFCGYMKSKGYETGIYTNADYLKNKFGSLGDYPLWLCQIFLRQGKLQSSDETVYLKGQSTRDIRRCGFGYLSWKMASSYKATWHHKNGEPWSRRYLFAAEAYRKGIWRRRYRRDFRY